MSPGEYSELIEIRDGLNAARQQEDWEKMEKATARLSALLGSLIGHRAR